MSEYKRLTEKTTGCFEYTLKDHKPVVGEFSTYEAFYDYSMAVRQLGKYEDIGSPEELAELAKAKTEGRLVVLPCKVGDTVYRLWYEPCHHGNDCPDGMSCCGCEDECDLKKAVVSRVYGHIQHIVSDLKYFGKTVFLTKEEAEAALKQNGGGHE